jgi:hypothetical protein
MSRDEIWRFVEERKWAYRGQQSSSSLHASPHGNMDRAQGKEDLY